jgi:hypothetical protein
MAVFWVVAPYSLVEVYLRFRGSCCLHHQGDAAESTSETSAKFYQTIRLNNPEDSHAHTRRRENLKYHLEGWSSSETLDLYQMSAEFPSIWRSVPIKADNSPELKIRPLSFEYILSLVKFPVGAISATMKCHGSVFSLFFNKP